MFGLGIWEIVVILVVALMVLGPNRLPQVAKQVGRALRELRRAASELQDTINAAADETALPKPPERRLDAPGQPQPIARNASDESSATQDAPATATPDATSKVATEDKNPEA